MNAPTDTTVDPLYTYEEAAKYLKLSPGTVRNMVSAGELAPVRLGKRATRVRLSELNRYIEVHTTTAEGK